MKTNWVRFIVGALIAAIIMFVSDGFFHERIVAADWQAVYANVRATPPEHGAIGLAYFAIFEIGRALILMLAYILMRPCCGAGPKTAVWAGVISWFAFSVTGPAQFIPLGFFSHSLWIKVGAFQLVTSIVAALAGAALYKDPPSIKNV